MNQNDRTKNSIKNICVSFGMQILLLVLSFVSRTVFIKILGEEYLGINGLYSNILSVLSLADLGLNTVMLYALYKPIADNDEDEIAKLIGYFKKIYRVIALAVLALGLICVPFLQYIVNGSELAIKDLRLFFLLYLLNTVCSYLIVYKTTIINADQRIYLFKIIDFIATLVLHLLQIIILWLTYNFIAYLIINIVITLTKNFVVSLITNKYYPFLRRIQKINPTLELKSKIARNIKSVFLYRVSAMIMNSTDNILISIILGTVIVGYYSNYLLVVTAVNTFISLLVQSILASLGNFNATERSERRLVLFKSLLLVFYVLATLCACCFLGVLNDFIALWIGGIDKSYILSNIDVIAIVFNFYVGCILNPVWMFRETTGLFAQTKYSMTAAAIVNIILSIILGKYLGLGGIVAATGLAKILTNFWYEPKVLFREVFKCSQIRYWVYILKQLILSIVCIITVFFLTKMMPGSLLFILLKILISGVVTGVIFAVGNLKTVEFKYILSLTLGKILKKREK